MTLPSRIEAKIMPVTECGCWLWTGALNSLGYGVIWLEGRNQYAHRVVYEFYRAIPEGLQLDHLCRVRCCVNPDHLESVTAKENTRRADGQAAKKAATHCKRGHEFTVENTRADFSRGVWTRQCKICDRIRAKGVGNGE